MNSKCRPIAFFLAFAVCGGFVSAAEDPASPSSRMNAYLASGRIAEGVESLGATVAERPDDAPARFALGILQFLRGVERLGQSWYRYGLQPSGGFGEAIPFLRLPVQGNPRAEPIRHADARRVLETFLGDLKTVDETLRHVRDEQVVLPLYFGMVRLDFDGDGAASEEEALWRIFARLTGERIDEREAADFHVMLDAGDVRWLQAYSNLLAGLLEFHLAYDHEALFNAVAHLFFRRPATPYPFLRHHPRQELGFGLVADAVALVHLINLPLREPERAGAALDHFRKVTRLSRESWRLIMAETDDNREWIPNPRQTSVIPGASVTDEMVAHWFAFLDEVDAILAGEKLIPFWRDAGGAGVNLRRVFTEPRPFDLILWVQGSAAAPYLEQGKLTQAGFWERLMEAFDGNFVGYALWFN